MKKIKIVVGLILAAALLPATAWGLERSALNNGDLELVATSQETGESGATRITAELISAGGANANNVRVEMRLVNAADQTVAESAYPGLDILHERPTLFELEAVDLAGGEYRLLIEVINKNDGLLNKDFRMKLNLESKLPVLPETDQVGEEASNPPEEPRREEQSEFFISPWTDAARQAMTWFVSRPADAALMQKMAKVAQAVWLGGWNADVEADTRAVVEAAREQRTTPVFVLYNIPGRDCGGYSAGGANSPAGYRDWTKAIARGLGGGPALVVLEPDALTLTDCLTEGDKQTRFNLMSEAAQALGQAGAAVYLDAGHSNWVPADEMARRLQAAGVAQAAGFALNVSNFYATPEIIRYGEEVSRRVGDKHFVVDTSRNGVGANGEWCNPSGRALGTPSTTDTGHDLVDAFVWFKPPGQSDGSCHGGPSAGVWWPEYALDLARRAGW